MLSGLVGAVAAAVPGIVDFFTIVDKRVKRIAFYHMLINLIAVALYALNLYLRSGAASPAGLPLALSVLAVILLGVSGWLGGELVYVYRVGVSPPSPVDTTQEKRRLREAKLRRAR